MKFCSTKTPSIKASLKEALLQGLSPDGALYFPEALPSLSPADFAAFSDQSFNEIAFEVLKTYCLEDFDEGELKEIVKEAFPFSCQIKQLNDRHHVLELFHGPTLAFKDFGANFLATAMSRLLKPEQQLTILVATSGDTGSAVAQAFYKKPGIRVVILYPEGKVSKSQEKQFSTLGQNISSLAIDGVFDDCQALVKQAFLDETIKNKYSLSSANSINIGRLLPQSLYYAYAYAQLKQDHKKIVFSVPSGNLGNLTSGLMLANSYQLDCSFVSALNNNKVFLDYLNSGHYDKRASVPTLANAMDVGDPSNFDRLNHLYSGKVQNFKNQISSYSFNDDDILRNIKDCWNQHQYMIDPHTAISYAGSLKHQGENPSEAVYISLSTAHPAKFPEVIEKAIDTYPELPDRLASCLAKESLSQACGKDYASFKKKLAEIL